MKALASLVLVTASLSRAGGLETALTWQKIDQVDGIEIFKRDLPDSDLIAFRGVGRIDAPITKVAAILSDTSRFSEWTPRLERAKDVRVLSPLVRIEYMHTSSGFFLVQDRDFVFMAQAEPNKAKGQIRFVLKSVEDPLAPETDKVRGTLKHGAYILTSVDEGRGTNLEVEIIADPKGSVPKWLVNLFQKSWPRDTINGIRRQAAKADVLEDHKIRELF